MQFTLYKRYNGNIHMTFPNTNEHMVNFTDTLICCVATVFVSVGVQHFGYWFHLW